MIAALYVTRGGPYWNRQGVEAWDRRRDARTYSGPWPVVAHPPCQAWGRFARLREARWGLKVGEDDGCFEAALRAVETYGGVLEHPKLSYAFATYGLARPRLGTWSATRSGAVTEVYQARYGHPAPKPTWLYYSGQAEPPTLDWLVVRSTGRHVYSTVDSHNRLSTSENSRTPLPFATLLISLAENSR